MTALKDRGGEGYIEVPGAVFGDVLGPVFIKVEQAAVTLSYYDKRRMEPRTHGPVPFRRLRPAPKTGFARHVEIEKELWRRLAWRDQVETALANLARLPRRR